MSNRFCDKLNKETCTILKMTCFRLKQGIKSPCDFRYHYKYLIEDIQNDPPKTLAVKKKMWPLVERNWKEYARSPSSGKNT